MLLTSFNIFQYTVSAEWNGQGDMLQLLQSKTTWSTLAVKQVRISHEGFTSARASIWRHGVSIFRTSTLVTARNVHTLVGTQMADALGTFVNVWSTRQKDIVCNWLVTVSKTKLGTNLVFVVCNRVFPTVTGVPVLPEVVALPAVALVGTIDVCTLLAARASQTLIHIWKLEVSAHYCHNLIKGSSVFLSQHINKMMLLSQLCFYWFVLEGMACCTV